MQKPTILKELELLQNSYMNNCSILKNINSMILETNKKLDHLTDSGGKLSLDTLNYFISLDEIQNRAMAYVDYYENQFISPFNHKLFNSEFWKHIRTHFLYEADNIFIEIEIPFYSNGEATLFALKPKLMTGQVNHFYIMFHNNTQLLTSKIPFCTQRQNTVQIV